MLPSKSLTLHDVFALLPSNARMLSIKAEKSKLSQSGGPCFEAELVRYAGRLSAAVAIAPRFLSECKPDRNRNRLFSRVSTGSLPAGRRGAAGSIQADGRRHSNQLAHHH